MAVLQMAVFRHGQWVRTLSGTIGANANRPFEKNHRGKRKCMGGFASQQRGTHFQVTLGYVSGAEKGVITKGVFSLDESLESLKSLNPPESVESGRNLLYFPQSGGSPKSLESLNSLASLQDGLS